MVVGFTLMSEITAVVLPRRWVVDRTLGWLGRYRRLSKDYELLPEVSESMIYLAMVRLMLRCLAS
jgi:putative transposase